jgi:hypothetical protein
VAATLGRALSLNPDLRANLATDPDLASLRAAGRLPDPARETGLRAAGPVA